MATLSFSDRFVTGRPSIPSARIRRSLWSWWQTAPKGKRKGRSFFFAKGVFQLRAISSNKTGETTRVETNQRRYCLGVCTSRRNVWRLDEKMAHFTFPPVCFRIAVHGLLARLRLSTRSNGRSASPNSYWRIIATAFPFQLLLLPQPKVYDRSSAILGRIYGTTVRPKK